MGGLHCLQIAGCVCALIDACVCACDSLGVYVYVCVDDVRVGVLRVLILICSCCLLAVD